MRKHLFLLSFFSSGCLVHRCDYIVAARRTSEHIVPSYFQITQNDKLDSNELIPF